MTVRRDAATEPSCWRAVAPIEDAEPLLELLLATPAAPLDWTQCDHLHTAVLQVILAARPAFWASAAMRGSGNGWKPPDLSLLMAYFRLPSLAGPWVALDFEPIRPVPAVWTIRTGTDRPTYPREQRDMHYKVLIVDDSKLARMVMASALRRIRPDWELVEATSAEDALARCRSARSMSRWWISTCRVPTVWS